MDRSPRADFPGKAVLSVVHRCRPALPLLGQAAGLPVTAGPVRLQQAIALIKLSLQPRDPAPIRGYLMIALSDRS
jgi:hypothetical protein